MLIYTGTKGQFSRDVLSNMIAPKIMRAFMLHGQPGSQAEYQAWENSLREMQLVLNDPVFPDDIQVAVEYQIPQTSKRVDFLIAGLDEGDNEHVVIVELKQWEEAEKTSTDGIVKTYTGGSVRAVAHPSYQAYSYAKTIENFNATVQDEDIGIQPCAYLHNYKADKLGELRAPIYQDILELAPLFIRGEVEKLRAFIRKYVSKSPRADILYKIDNGRIRPSKSLQDTIASMLKGNQEFVLIDEQKVVFEAVRQLVAKSQQNNQKYTVIVEGGPGTGKSVVAIQLLVDLISNQSLNGCYVTKNAAPRNVYFEMLKRGKALNNYVKALFKSSGVFHDCEPDTFDFLIVDEAHRLNAKSGMFRNKGENQIKEIIGAAKVSVFFIDENQVVTSSDIGSVAEIIKWAQFHNSKLYRGEQYNLTSQFRCNGSDGYIAFIDHLLGIREQPLSIAETRAPYGSSFTSEYIFEVFDDPNEMREALRKKNLVNNKSRMIAGYCYEWRTKDVNDADVFDIELPGGFKAKWNFSTTLTWAIDPDSFDQVGCIHTSQGLEFDYVGVIIGNDLRFEGGRVITDPSKRAKTDHSLRGLKKRADYKEQADRIIRNTYRTLLTRGQKGCFVYCEDPGLREYLKNNIQGAF